LDWSMYNKASGGTYGFVRLNRLRYWGGLLGGSMFGDEEMWKARGGVARTVASRRAAVGEVRRSGHDRVLTGWQRAVQARNQQWDDFKDSVSWGTHTTSYHPQRLNTAFCGLQAHITCEGAAEHRERKEVYRLQCEAASEDGEGFCGPRCFPQGGTEQPP
jgi:hypothetical protein